MSIARCDAMARNCRNRGGSCPCTGESCAAEKTIREELRLAREVVSELSSTLAYLLRKPCTVRPDWKVPEKPEGDYLLCVILDDGWELHWHSETESIDWVEISGDDGWPFVEQTAYAEDWERLGVTVV